jgi:hypothetical protein
MSNPKTRFWSSLTTVREMQNRARYHFALIRSDCPHHRAGDRYGTYECTMPSNTGNCSCKIELCPKLRRF